MKYFPCSQSLVMKEIRKIPAPEDPEFLRNLEQQDRKERQGLKFVFPEERPREVINKDTHNVECQAMSQDHGLHAQVSKLMIQGNTGGGGESREGRLQGAVSRTQVCFSLGETKRGHQQGHP